MCKQSVEYKWQFPQTGIFRLHNCVFPDLNLNTIALYSFSNGKIPLRALFNVYLIIGNTKHGVWVDDREQLSVDITKHL